MSVIIYQDHIEVLEEENAELQKEVLILRRKLEYYKTIVEQEEEEINIGIVAKHEDISRVYARE